MPEHIRALVVILFLAAAVFWFARQAICEHAFSPDDYRRRRNLWFACVLLAFLSHNFWVFMILTAVLLRIAGKKEHNPLALYCMLLFAVPALSATIPGFGLVNYLFDINYVRLLALVILLPAAIKLRSERHLRQQVSRFPDLAVAFYLLFDFVMHFQDDTLTNSLRQTFYTVMQIALPYYVASRALTNIRQYREVFAALVLALAVMAPIAAFETARFWHVYDSLYSALGLPPAFFRTYLTRGAGGLLRAYGTTGQPIVLGYVMMIGISLLAFLSHESRYRTILLIAAGSLGAGLVASLSRGPWIGAAVALMVIVCLGPGRAKRVAWSVGIGGTAIVALLLSPLGETMIDYLPFVGSVEEENVDYRFQLWTVSMEVIRLNPWVGDVNFMENPVLEQMRQGQGIIDIVNSYLQVALELGIIGLVLFVAPFIYALATIRRLQRRSIAAGNLEVERLARVLLATLIGIMVTIVTVSSIGVIPIVYWLIIGLCIGTRHAAWTEENVEEAPAPQPAFRNTYDIRT